jgi:hypothetical protein
MSIILKRDLYSNEIKNFKKILDDNKDQNDRKMELCAKKRKIKLKELNKTMNYFVVHIINTKYNKINVDVFFLVLTF